jgi:hypothetical protein
MQATRGIYTKLIKEKVMKQEALKKDFIKIVGYFVDRDDRGELALAQLERDLSSAVESTVLRSIATSVLKKIIPMGLAKISVEQIPKSGLKKIPGAGLVIAAILAVVKAIQGNYAGAVGEVASGAAACIPGVGTTVSFAIDGAMTAKDIGEKIKSFNVSKLEPSIT